MRKKQRPQTCQSFPQLYGNIQDFSSPIGIGGIQALQKTDGTPKEVPSAGISFLLQII
jgi:hypothetical protein